MKKQDLNLWNKITFKTQGYRKNFDLINNNDRFITEYEGKVSILRIREHKLPIQIGEFGFSVWNIELGEKFGANFLKLIKEYAVDDTYDEFYEVISSGGIKITDYKKIVIIHSFVLAKDYRKRGITEEFIEMLYCDYYGDNIAIIMIVKPYQNNLVNTELFKHKKIILNETLKSSDAIGVPAMTHYSLDELLDNEDTELNEYKLFAVANKCGFQRINESHLFILSPEKIKARMFEKQSFSQQVETE